VTLNSGQVRKFLKSPQVQAMLAHRAARVRNATGSPNFDTDVRVGRDRARGYVFPKNYKGRVEQAKHHTLERAVGGLS